jgi:hypothetical protein
MNKIIRNNTLSTVVTYIGKGNSVLHSECSYGKNLNSICIQD